MISVLVTDYTTHGILSIITETSFITEPNLLPVIVTSVPPDVGPMLGVRSFITGV